MKEDLKEFLSFNKAERRGVFILSIIVVLLILYNIFGPFAEVNKSDFSEFKNKIARYKAIKDSIEFVAKGQKKLYAKVYSKAKRSYNLKSFDPNVISKQEWIDMGLSSKQAASIIKFVSKGGKFYNPNDLRKLYCLSSTECDKFIPYVLIQEDIPDEDFGIEKEEEYLSIDLNSASKENLELVKGIGPATAKGIIKYRQILGGYFSVNQLKEVFLIDSVKFENVKNNFIVNRDSIHIININNASYYKLRRHPYISKQMAYEIVQYRSMKGNYNSKDDLLKVKGMSDSLYQKIYLYFAFSQEK